MSSPLINKTSKNITLLKIGYPTLLELKCLDCSELTDKILNTIIEINFMDEEIDSDISLNHLFNEQKKMDTIMQIDLLKDDQSIKIKRIDCFGFRWSMEWMNTKQIKLYLRIHNKPRKIRAFNNGVKNLFKLKINTHILDSSFHCSSIFGIIKPYFTDKVQNNYLGKIKSYYHEKEKAQKMLNKSKLYQFEMYCLHKKMECGNFDTYSDDILKQKLKFIKESYGNENNCSQKNIESFQKYINRIFRIKNKINNTSKKLNNKNKRIKKLYYQINKNKSHSKLKLKKKENELFENITNNIKSSQKEDNTLAKIEAKTISKEEKLIIIKAFPSKSEKKFMSNPLDVDCSNSVLEKYCKPTVKDVFQVTNSTHNFVFRSKELLEIIQKMSHLEFNIWLKMIGMKKYSDLLKNFSGDEILKLSSQDKIDIFGKEDANIFDICIGIKTMDIKILNINYKLEQNNQHSTNSNKIIVLKTPDKIQLLNKIGSAFKFCIENTTRLKIKSKNLNDLINITNYSIVQLPSRGYFNIKLIKQTSNIEESLIILEEI